MFGQQNNQSDQQDTQIPEQSIDGVLSSAQPNDSGAAPLDPAWQHPGAPLDQSAPASDASAPIGSVAGDQMPANPAPSNDQPAANPFGTPSHPDDDAAQPTDLADIKQQALEQLSPLVGHLEQSPEDKFRTLMMMIQASDDQSKLSEAYQAAQAITDEKTRAQALLDVVNEINYFTQQHDSQN